LNLKFDTFGFRLFLNEINMIDDQITALAREYAESRYPEAKTDEDDFLYDSAVYVMEDNLRWLLCRYCLVEKSKLRAQYAKWMQQFCSTRDVAAKEYAAGRLNALEFLFPEIAKEVEV
jgi:hypothetical protein